MGGPLRRAGASLALVGCVVAGCGSSGSGTQASTATVMASARSVDSVVSGEVVVFAASSLTEAFTAAGDEFTAQHPEVNLVFNFAGSGDLVSQIVQGAPADVFASADDSDVTELVDAGETGGEPVIVARNSMEIIVERGNPKAVSGLGSLTDPEVVVVLCADTVPCGRNAAKVLANAGVAVTPRSFEDKVKGVVTKVTAGEADAGIVYVTDVEAAVDAGSADGVEIPADLNVTSSYPMVLTRAARNPEAARAFIGFIAGDAGQAILARYGFLAP